MFINAFIFREDNDKHLLDILLYNEKPFKVKLLLNIILKLIVLSGVNNQLKIFLHLPLTCVEFI